MLVYEKLVEKLLTTPMANILLRKRGRRNLDIVTHWVTFVNDCKYPAQRT